VFLTHEIMAVPLLLNGRGLRGTVTILDALLTQYELARISATRAAII
jgi:hypothetical protein